MISVTDLGQRTSTRKTKKIIKNKPQENSEAVKAKTPKKIQDECNKREDFSI